MPEEIESGYYKVRGPGLVEPLEGTVEALGASIAERLLVPAGRTLLVRVDGRARLRGSSVELGSGEEYDRLDSLAREAARRGRVFLVGPSDAGKSTLTAWIANRMGSGRILTLDVGQNELFAPGFAAAARIEPPVVPGVSQPVQTVEPCFVGVFSPARDITRYLYCAMKLSRDSGGLVVDTDGWVEVWDGLRSKAAAALATGARLILAVGLGRLRAWMLEDYTGIEVVSVERLARASKSGEERRLHRDRLLSQRLAGARERPVRRGETVIEGLPLFAGDPLSVDAVRSIVPGAIYAENVDGRVVVVVNRRPPRVADRSIRVVPLHSLEGLIAAVHYKGIIEPAVVSRVNVRSGVISVYTKMENVEKLEIGRDKVDIDSILGRAKW